MAYFDGPDSVDQKVQSCFFTAEVRDGQLWGVAKCKVRGELTPLELKCLTDGIGDRPLAAAGYVLHRPAGGWRAGLYHQGR